MTTTRPLTEAEVRNHSYKVRENIAVALGKPLHTDFSCRVACYFRDAPGEFILESTSNAGFRGIEGWFLCPDGEHHHYSLGEIDGCRGDIS